MKQTIPRRAIVMGATSGIGLEVVKVLASKGWQLGVAGRRDDVLQQLKDEVPQVMAVRAIDITRDDAPQRLVGRARVGWLRHRTIR